MISAVSGTNNYNYYLSQLRQSGSQGGTTSDKLFSKIDANGDGSISKDELSAFESSMQAQFQNSVTGSQQDSMSLLALLQGASGADGSTSNTGATTAQSTSANDLFSKIDTNGDGSISKDELAKAMSGHHHHHHAESTDSSSQAQASSPLDQLFSKIDTNGDGSISKDELTTFRSTMSAGESASQTGTSTTGTTSDQQGQTNSTQFLLSNAIRMYMQFNPLLSNMNGYAGSV